MNLYENMKGKLLLKALEIIGEFAYTTAEFVEVFLASSKGNYLKLRHFKQRSPNAITEKLRSGAEEKQRFYELLFRLQKNNLITKMEEKEKKIWKITKKGKEKLIKLKTKSIISLPNNKNYKIQPSAEIIIISFDIPEKEKYKRDWLRSVLINLGFKLLQKSVWIGKVKIPTELIDDFKKFNLFSYLEIFAVSKTGTIKQLA